MSKISAYAPGKVILFGEHFVVYGAPGLACAIEPYNRIELSVSRPGAGSARAARDWSKGPIEAEEAAAFASSQPGLEYATSIGTLTVRPMAGSISDLSVVGPAPLRAQAESYKTALKLSPALSKLSIQARAGAVWPVKGVGNSASLAAALAAGLLAAAGKNPTPAQLVECAQAADTLAHGARPSGIDASAVSYGQAVLYQKSFEEKKQSLLKAQKLSMAKGWSLLLVDTLLPGEEKGSTAEQISRFAAAHGISKAPAELPEKERAHLCAPYSALFKKAQAALAKKDMASLGKCMNENQALLAAGDVSTPAIDRAVDVARQAGAAGAKLSGAGGPGGLVLVLCADKKKAAIEKALSGQGMRCYELKIAPRGAYAEKN
ncbi:MAG: hypothetical protein KGH63_01435 [Candidatus Micrarchaeota archaeon]|nr:hypothetical protein [Candidatus Micrarchaeota archaeon]